MQMSKRRFMALGSLSVAALALGAAHAGPARNEKVIKIEARKFRFAPNLITLKKGEAVVLELTAVDFPHGFSVPELKVRADLVMGKAVQVRLQPQEEGTFTFLCDNFCGSGHEEMAGTIVVKA